MARLTQLQTNPLLPLGLIKYLSNFDAAMHGVTVLQNVAGQALILNWSTMSTKHRKQQNFSMVKSYGKYKEPHGRNKMQEKQMLPLNHGEVPLMLHCIK